jgi:hypothetical protein
MKFYNKFRHFTPIFLLIADSILFFSIYFLNIKTGLLTPESLLPQEFGKEIAIIFWNQGLAIGLIALLFFQFISYVLFFKKIRSAQIHLNLWKATALLFLTLSIATALLAGLYYYLFLTLLIPIYLIIKT